MSGADVHFHQYRTASRANSPSRSKQTSRAASPTSSKPASRAASKQTSRRGSRNEDAKKIAKVLSTNEWRAAGIYSDSRPGSKSNSRRNSLTKQLKHQLKSSDSITDKHENVIDSEAIHKALKTMEWKSTGVYSNPSSAANSRRNSLTGKSNSAKPIHGETKTTGTKSPKTTSPLEWNNPGIYSSSRKNTVSEKSMKKLKSLIQTEIHNENIDPEDIRNALIKMAWKAPGVYSNPSSAANSRRNSLTGQSHINGKPREVNSFEVNETERALKTCEWKTTGVYSSKPVSASNSRRNSITDKSSGKITRGTEKHVVNGVDPEQELTKEAIAKALNSCEWRASGVYSSRPSSRSTSRRASPERSSVNSPTRVKNEPINASKHSNEDPITVFFRATSRPTSRRGSISEEGSQVPSFPLMSFAK